MHPDLLPSDIVGTQVYDASTAGFTTHLGPVHANIVLLDEINRASAKTQSAMLEAMQERQTSIGGQAYPLPAPFLVLATQNPIEQEGTYVLPEAQLDRFMLKDVLDYPTLEEEAEVLYRIDAGVFREDQKPVVGIDDVTAAGADAACLPRPGDRPVRRRHRLRHPTLRVVHRPRAGAVRRVRRQPARGASPSPRRPAPARSWPAATTSCRRTSRRSRTACCGTGLFSGSRPSRTTPASRRSSTLSSRRSAPRRSLDKEAAVPALLTP